VFVLGTFFTKFKNQEHTHIVIYQKALAYSQILDFPEKWLGKTLAYFVPSISEKQKVL
jgi:hypothetical protein